MSLTPAPTPRYPKHCTGQGKSLHTKPYFKRVIASIVKMMDFPHGIIKSGSIHFEICESILALGTRHQYLNKL